MRDLRIGAIDADAIDAHAVIMCARLQTVVETPAYLSAAKGILSDRERRKVVNMVAEDPETGLSLGAVSEK